MIRRRTARITLAAGLAATALSAAVLPAQAATGTGWRIVSAHHFGAAGLSNFFDSVVAPTASDAWAFGSSSPPGADPAGVPIAERWNGTSWRAASLLSGVSGNITAASAPSDTDVWAVTDLTGYVLHYDGAKWSVALQLPDTGDQQLSDVTAFSPTNVWVFGGPSAFPGLGVWHLHGGTWTQLTGLAAEITAASALSPSDIWAVSGNLTGADDIIEHYNGSTWQQVTGSALDNVLFTQSILAMSSANVWATGSVPTGNTAVYYLLHMSGTSWTRIKIPWAVATDGIAPDGTGGLWILARTPGTTTEYVLHRTASGVWSRSKIGASDELFDITSIPGTTSLWGTGLKELTSGSNAAIWAYGTLP